MRRVACRKTSSISIITGIYLEAQLKKAADGGAVSFFPDTQADAEMLKEKGYDAIVTAIGTKGAMLKLPRHRKGAHRPGDGPFGGPGVLGDAKKAVVIGGGVVGCETAYWLSYEKGCGVTVVEMLPYFMDGACTANRGHLIYYMKKTECALLTSLKLSPLTKEG
jgi:2-enoate reductase